MAAKDFHPRASHQPLVLIVPETGEASPDDWQVRWEQHRQDCQRLDLGMWDNPHRNTWVNKLNLALYRAERPVLLVAHGIGCLTVAWWAEYERPSIRGPVIGALLVAPPDVERPGGDPRLAKFAATPREPLPFNAFLVASRNDPGCAIRSAVSLARDWDCRFADAGEAGHFDAGAGLGDWQLGEQLVEQLLREHRPASAAADPIRMPTDAPSRPIPQRPSLRDS